MVGETRSPLLCSFVLEQDCREPQVPMSSCLISARAAFCSNSCSRFPFLSHFLLFQLPSFSQSSILASFQGADERKKKELVPRHGGGGGERPPGTHCFAHVCNYSRGHVAELEACTNMTINSSRNSINCHQLLFLGCYKHRCYMLCLVLYCWAQREMSGRLWQESTYQNYVFPW